MTKLEVALISLAERHLGEAQSWGDDSGNAMSTELAANHSMSLEAFVRNCASVWFISVRTRSF